MKISTDAPKHEFRPRCSICSAAAATIRLFEEAGQWRLVYSGPGGSNGGGGDALDSDRARSIVSGFTEPYVGEKIRAADFHDDAGFCLPCGAFYCVPHWNVSSTGGGRCPQGHFKSLDPHWSPDEAR
jgi:hypothetical protein